MIISKLEELRGEEEREQRQDRMEREIQWELEIAKETQNDERLIDLFMKHSQEINKIYLALEFRIP